MTDTKHAQEGPETAREAAFASFMLSYHRRAPAEATAALMRELAEAVADGADQGELLRLAALAVAELPPPN